MSGLPAQVEHCSLIGCWGFTCDSSGDPLAQRWWKDRVKRSSNAAAARRPVWCVYGARGPSGVVRELGSEQVRPWALECSIACAGVGDRSAASWPVPSRHRRPPAMWWPGSGARWRDRGGDRGHRPESAEF